MSKVDGLRRNSKEAQGDVSERRGSGHLSILGLYAAAL